MGVQKLAWVSSTLACALLIALVAAEAGLADEAKPSGPRRWALLVGIDDYAEINDLRYCGRDTHALCERLLAAGFREEDVVVLDSTAPTAADRPLRATVLSRLEALLAGVGEDDLVLFAFSGHGVELGTVSYLCPIEARLEAPATLIELEQVYRRLAACKARQKLLVVDACRNDPRKGHERSITRATDSQSGFVRALERAPEGIAVLASCRPGQVSVEDDQLGHGVFMHFLLKGLQGEADRDGGNQDRRVSLFELYRYVDRQTRAHVARQRDLVQTPVLRGEVAGDYELGRLSDEKSDVAASWDQLVRNPDGFADSSPALKFLALYLEMSFLSQERFAQQDRAAGREDRRDVAGQRRFWSSICRSPQAIVLASPSLITARDPRTLRALRHAYAFAAAGDCDAAIAAASEAITLEPENPFGYMLRGMAYHAKCATWMRLSSREDFVRFYGMAMADEKSALGEFQMAIRETVRALAPEIPGLDKALERLDAAGGPNASAEQFGALLKADSQAAIRLLEQSREILGSSIHASAIQGADAETLQILQKGVDRAAEIARQRVNDCLEKGPADFQKIGLGGFTLGVKQDTDFRVEGRTVGKTTSYFENVEVLQVQGDWLWVRRLQREDRQEGWIQRKDISSVAVSLLQILQLPHLR